MDDLSQVEKSELLSLGIQIARPMIEEDGYIRFYRFFAEMVRNFGDGIRPFVKSIYLGASAEVAKDVFLEMDDAETVRDYDENTVFGDFVFEEMINIRYPSWERIYPSLVLTIPKSIYLKNPDEYKELTVDVVEQIIAQKEIEEELEQKWGYNSWTIAELVWQELVNQGLNDTIIEEWDDSEIEEEIYLQNLPEDERSEMIEERKAAWVDSFMRILNHDRYFHD